MLFTAVPPRTGYPTDVLAFEAKLKYARNWDLDVFSLILKQNIFIIFVRNQKPLFQRLLQEKSSILYLFVYNLLFTIIKRCEAINKYNSEFELETGFPCPSPFVPRQPRTYLLHSHQRRY